MPSRPTTRASIEKRATLAGIVLSVLCVASCALVVAGLISARSRVVELFGPAASAPAPAGQPGAGPAPAPAAPAPPTEPAVPQGYAVVSKGRLFVEGRPFMVVGIDYNYSELPEKALYTPGAYVKSTRAAVAAEIALVKSTPCTVLRVFVPYKAPPIVTDCRLYVPVSARSYTIEEGDRLEYQVLFPAGSVSLSGGVDVRLDDGRRLAGLDLKDTKDQDASARWEAPKNQAGVWIKREIPLKGLAGRKITEWCLALEGDKAGRQVVQVKDVRITNPLGIAVFELPTTDIRKQDTGIEAVSYQDVQLSFPQNTPQLAANCTGPVDPSAVPDLVVKYSASQPVKYLAGIAGDLAALARGAGSHGLIHVMTDHPDELHAEAGFTTTDAWLKTFVQSLPAGGELLGINIGDGVQVTDDKGAVRPEVVAWLGECCAAVKAASPKTLVWLTLYGKIESLADVARRCGRQADVLVIKPTGVGSKTEGAMGAIVEAAEGAKPIVLDLSGFTGALSLSLVTDVIQDPEVAANFSGGMVGELVGWSPEGAARSGLKAKTGLFDAKGQKTRIFEPYVRLLSLFKEPPPEPKKAEAGGGNNPPAPPVAPPKASPAGK